MYNEIKLPGCRPDPIASYLSALGVLRLVSRQADSGARGYWQMDEFRLLTTLSHHELVDFFVERYVPTPIVTPWSGGSGFFDKDNKTYVEAIEASGTPRLEPYRRVIAAAKEVLSQHGIVQKPKEKDKLGLLRMYRSLLPQDALDWLDAAFTLTESGVSYFPLLGTGGNDGRLDFAQNFMANLTRLLLKPGPSDESRRWLESALFDSRGAPLCQAAVGQFHPGGVGGPNATTGFEGESLVNPWSYVLMIEGSIAWAGAVSRRMGTDTRGRAAFPFTVSTASAGWPTLADSEASSSRAEIWMPLWARPALYDEIAHVLSEGRATVGRRQARNTVDFALAAAQLGVDRGIRAFYRYSLVRRSGKAFLASPVGTIVVRERPESNLVNEVLPWLDGLRRLASGPDGSAAQRAALRGIDDAIVEYCSFGGPSRLTRVLAALGRAERLLARGAGSKMNEAIQPLHHLSPRWLGAAYDGSVEFRLAAAAASIRDPKAGSIRFQIEPVQLDRRRLAWADRSSATTVLAGSNVTELFINTLSRRLVLAVKHGLTLAPIGGLIPASLGDIHSFISGHVNSEILADLFWAMTTMRWAEYSRRLHWSPGPAPTPPDIPRSYATLKLVFLPKPLAWPQESDLTAIRFEPEALRRLSSEDITGAMLVALRRLRASGFSPLLPVSEFAGQNHVFPASAGLGKRLAASLLFPISDGSVTRLCEVALRNWSVAATRA